MRKQSEVKMETQEIGIGSVWVSENSGFRGVIVEIVKKTENCFSFRLVNDRGVEKWTSVSVEPK
jgi:hypothetical protein